MGFKNIYAIVSGYFHQKGVGENTIGLLLTKCLEEMRLFSQAKGANSSTFLGLSESRFLFNCFIKRLETIGLALC